MYKVIITNLKGIIVRETVPITIAEVIDYCYLYQVECDVIVVPETEINAW